MTRRPLLALAVVVFTLGPAELASSQSRPAPRPAASRAIEIGGYATFGRLSLTAAESFDAVLGEHTGPVFGGGARVGLPFGGLFIDVGGARFKQTGQRVFVTASEVFPLGIPLTITLTPIEVTAGWKFRLRNSRLAPYVGGGITSLGYQETSSFASADEDTTDRFNGYHLLGGAEYRLMRWLGIGGEFAWTTVPDAIGQAGASKVFGETDLGGTSFRAKVTIGR